MKARITTHLRFSNIRVFDIYSSIDFQKSVFSIYAYSQVQKLGSQKSEISKRPAEHPAFLIFVNIKNTKTWIFLKVTIFGQCLNLTVQASVLFIFTQKLNTRTCISHLILMLVVLVVFGYLVENGDVSDVFLQLL